MRRQIRYQKATEGRINFTSEVLGSFKSVKILGYGERFMQFLREKRDFDLSEGKAFRWIAVWSNGICTCIYLSLAHSLCNVLLMNK